MTTICNQLVACQAAPRRDTQDGQDVRHRRPGRFLQRRYDDGVAFRRYEGVMVLLPGTAIGPVWKVTPGSGVGGVTTEGTGAGGGAGGSGVKVGAGS
jgi:hypothetical protein